jgi:hypothetical protein
MIRIVRAPLFSLIAFLSCVIALRAQEPLPDATANQPALEIPKGYEIGQESASPDGRFAILYPVREEDGAGDYPPNLLVQLKPYAVLVKLGEDEGRPQGARGEPLAKWNGNSVVAIWLAAKWGSSDLWVYEIDHDKVKRVHPVFHEARKHFERDFRERFLKKYPKESGSFVFVSDGNEERGVQEIEFKGRTLLLNLFADNKPNLAAGPHWTASLHAVWDLDKAKFGKVDFRPGKIEVRGDP